MATDFNAEYFLRNLLLPHRTHEPKVNVTLTFAQSVDAKIAGPDGQQLILSGKESMLMTHWMRSMHDAILVGIGTALKDNPQLNTRLLALEQSFNPQPVILDCGLRFRSDSKLMSNYRSGKGKQPWIFTKECGSDAVHRQRCQDLEKDGARVVQVPCVEGLLSLSAILGRLYELNVKSLMVEGGARVIQSFMRSGLVDQMVLTIAPVIVGELGVGYAIPSKSEMEFIQTINAGRDTVVAWKVMRPS